MEIQTLLWNYMHVIIFCFVCAPSYIVSKIDGFEIPTYHKILIAFSRIICMLYPTAKFAYYVHIVIEHSADLILQCGSLLLYSNEAVENLHCLIKQQKQRGTSDGGKKSANNFVVQVIAYVLCRIYLMLTYQITWEKDGNVAT